MTRNKVSEVRHELLPCTGAVGYGADHGSTALDPECLTNPLDPLGEYERQERLTPQTEGIALREALDRILKPEGLCYLVRDGKIVLRKQ